MNRLRSTLKHGNWALVMLMFLLQWGVADADGIAADEYATEATCLQCPHEAQPPAVLLVSGDSFFDGAANCSECCPATCMMNCQRTCCGALGLAESTQFDSTSQVGTQSHSHFNVVRQIHLTDIFRPPRQ